MIVQQPRSKIKRQISGADIVLPQNELLGRQTEPPGRRIRVFVCNLLGVFASFACRAALGYIADPTQPVAGITLPMVGAWVILSLCFAPWIFLPVYQKLYGSSDEEWVVCLQAFRLSFLGALGLYILVQNYL